MAELFAGAGLGAVVSELLKAVIDAISTLISFQPSLKQLRETLESVRLNIEKLGGIGEGPEIRKLEMKLREGKTLVGKCTRVQPWNYYLQTRYSYKILELDNDLKRFFQMDVQADIWCDNKQMRRDIKQIKQILLGEVTLFDPKLDLLKTEIGTMNVGAGATDGDQGVYDPVDPGIQLANRLDQSVAFKKRREMTTRGTLEVLLGDAYKLKDTDIFGKMDPYVIIQFGNQKQTSTVARGEGKAPVWNEKFTFDVEYPDIIRDELNLTIMDKDWFSKDDFVGESTINLTDVLSFGVKNGRSEIRVSSPVLLNNTYSGEIRVGISFTVYR